MEYGKPLWLVLTRDKNSPCWIDSYADWEHKQDAEACANREMLEYSGEQFAIAQVWPVVTTPKVEPKVEYVVQIMLDGKWSDWAAYKDRNRALDLAALWARNSEKRVLKRSIVEEEVAT